MTRILVVEDEEHLAEGLRFNLEAEGYEVAIEGDGLRAVEALAARERPVDLVILDLMLPGLSGFEVLRRARAAGDFVPVLILTAKDGIDDRVRGLEEGADDFSSSRSASTSCSRARAGCCAAGAGTASPTAHRRRRSRSARRRSTSTASRSRSRGCR